MNILIELNLYCESKVSIYSKKSISAVMIDTASNPGASNMITTL